MYGRIIQTLGILTVIIAIEMQVWTRAEPWTIITTTGSLLFALGTKVVYFSKKKR